MSIKVFTSLISEIRAKQFRSVYFLEGDEPYFIDKVADALEKEVLTQAEKAFNFQIMYGREVGVLDILTAARRFPMMANHQLILIREAQYLKKIEEILPYIESVVPSTILVFLYKGKKLNKATKLGKALKNQGLLTTKKLYESEMTGWLTGHLKTSGLSADPKAMQLLIHAAGNNLHHISSELEKIKANMGNRTAIIADDVARHTGLSKDYNVFELTKSLGQRNRAKSLQIARYFASNPKENPFIKVLGSIFNYFKKVHQVHHVRSSNSAEVAQSIGMSPYFVSEYMTAAGKYKPFEMPTVFNLIHEFDLKSKGMGGGQSNEYELLTELIVRIIK